jgi:hypothetical protein
MNLESVVFRPLSGSSSGLYNELRKCSTCLGFPFQTGTHVAMNNTVNHRGSRSASIQHLWLHKAPVHGRTTVSNESLCQVARNWMGMGSFRTRLFGVMYVTCGDFHDGPEKGTVSSPSSFWQNTKCLSSPTHRNPLILHPVTSSYFQN